MDRRVLMGMRGLRRGVLIVLGTRRHFERVKEEDVGLIVRAVLICLAIVRRGNLERWMGD